MKKLLLIAVFVGLLVPAAHAGKLRNNVGCGVGTLLFEATGNSNAGWLLQTLASWTNGILYSGFSVTTGTVGCQGTISQVVEMEKVNIFIADNMDNLAKDIAMGKGETVTTLASMMNIADVEMFTTKLQSNFATIFPNSEVQPSEVLVKIIEINS